jgi:hypothetical protein
MSPTFFYSAVPIRHSEFAPTRVLDSHAVEMNLETVEIPNFCLCSNCTYRESRLALFSYGSCGYMWILFGSQDMFCGCSVSGVKIPFDVFCQQIFSLPYIRNKIRFGRRKCICCSFRRFALVNSLNK